MATEIKRVRFFDGQFLKEIDFRDEQRYHVQLRRRMNFMLFGSSGVVAMTPNDLTLEVVSAADKTFRVRAGMAISRNTVSSEGMELILDESSAPIDLDSSGIVAGGTAFVALHYEELEAKDPPSEGDVDENTRVKERAILTVHAGPPPAATASGDPFVVLGTLSYDSMAIGTAARQQAFLRASLIAPSAVPAPSVSSVSGVVTAAPGATVAMVINGSNLAGATLVSFVDPLLTAIINSSSATSINVSVSVGAGAVAGPKSFQVTTPGGTAPSPGGVIFTVIGAVPAPSIVGIDVHDVAQGTNVPAVITGTNLLGVSAVSFGANVTVTIGAGGTAVSLPVTLGVALGAVVGVRSFSVTTPGGTATSPAGPAASFSISAALPAVALLSLQPNLQLAGGTIDVHGTNLRNPGIAVGAAATGTAVALRKGANSKAALNVIARPDVAGHQVVRITIPDRTGTPWAKTEIVTLDLSFTGATGTASLPFTFDDP